MRPNPYRRPASPQGRRAEMMRSARMRRIAADLPWELFQPISDADDALGEAEGYLTQLAQEVQWLPNSAPDARDVAKVKALVTKAAEELAVLQGQLEEAMENE